jgi:hypothetical protein
MIPEWRIDFAAYCLRQERKAARREWWSNRALMISTLGILLAWAVVILLPIWV